MMNEEYEDVRIKCQDCGTSFIFSKREQIFYDEKNFIPPKRCRQCRKIKSLKFSKGGHE